VIPRVIERYLRGRDICGVKAGRQGLQVCERADQQPGAGQQHDRKHDFTGNQRLANAAVACARCRPGGRRGERRTNLGAPHL